jgi:hypothetical protein
MKLRTIFILIAMMFVVVATSAFGAYKDSEHAIEPPTRASSNLSGKSENTVVGASGAGTSYKQSQSHLDVSEKADGPYHKDGTNTYRGKAGGYNLRDQEEGRDDDDDSDAGDLGDSDGNPSEFQKKMKYISTMFEEIFSKWKSNETIMAPSGMEEIETVEGFKIREKFKKGARQGMRKLKNAFRGRFK